MRIAMVSPYDLSVHGGVQGQVLGLSAAMRDLGHEVLVVAPGRRGASEDGRTVRVGRSVGVRANGSVAPASLSPAAAYRAARIVRNPDIDVVHLHEPLAPVINYGCLLAARQPMVGTFHRNGASVLYRLFGPLARWALGRLAVRCAVSESARDNVASSLGRGLRGPVQRHRRGRVLDRYADSHHRAHRALRRSTRAPQGAGRPARGVGVGSPAGRAVDRRRWSGHRRAATPAPAVEDACSGSGAITDEQKVAGMAGADVFCAPSIGGESFGIVLLEAMAAGCAIVASDIEGYRDASSATRGWSSRPMRRRWPPRSTARCSTRPPSAACRRTRHSTRRGSGPTSGPWPSWPAAISRSTNGCWPSGGEPPPRAGGSLSRQCQTAANPVLRATTRAAGFATRRILGGPAPPSRWSWPFRPGATQPAGRVGAGRAEARRVPPTPRGVRRRTVGPTPTGPTTPLQEPGPRRRGWPAWFGPANGREPRVVVTQQSVAQGAAPLVEHREVRANRSRRPPDQRDRCVRAGAGGGRGARIGVVEGGRCHRGRRRFGADRRGLPRLATPFALRLLHARPLREDELPRLQNLVDGLCPTFGVRRPTLMAVDDELPNACSLGYKPDRGCWWSQLGWSRRST